MTQFVQQIVAGLATAAIYASLALALVLIHRATGVINFAQGEMGMFSHLHRVVAHHEPRLARTGPPSSSRS